MLRVSCQVTLAGNRPAFLDIFFAFMTLTNTTAPKAEIKPAGRKRAALTPSTVRSAITNGSSILANVDARSAWVRRFKDLLHAHQTDLGGDDILSEGQRSILRRAAMLELQCEMLESKFAANGGAATPQELDCYQRSSNSLRRLIESLGLHRGRLARDVTGPTLGQLLRQDLDHSREAGR
jgi:hypothetical protein